METMSLGIAGVVILLTVYVFNQFNILKNSGVLYDGGNFVGASLLVMFAYEIGAWPFVVLELVWAAVSLRDLIRDIAHSA